MRRVLLSLLIVTALAFAVSARDERIQCPMISITGPAGVSLRDQAITFVVEVVGDAPKDLTYSWSVKGGSILNGQGTTRLKASYSSWPDVFKVSVIVGGLPPRCNTEASEGLNMSGPEPVPELLATVSSSTYSLSRQSLAKIRKSLDSNPHSQLYVIAYTDELEERRGAIRSRLVRQLVGSRIDPSRFAIEIVTLHARRVVFWRVPPGVETPIP